MDLMNARFKFGFKRTGKDNKTSSSPTPSHPNPVATPSNGTSPTSPPSNRSSSTTSLPAPLNTQPARPPSYAVNNRPTSPLAPGQLVQQPASLNPQGLPYAQPGAPQQMNGPPDTGCTANPWATASPQICRSTAATPSPRSTAVIAPTRPNLSSVSISVPPSPALPSLSQPTAKLARTSSPSGRVLVPILSRRAGQTVIRACLTIHLPIDQIPTVLYYDQYQKVVGWGPDIAEALAPTGYPKPGVQKSEIDVAADYLFKLRQAMRAQLQKTLGEVFTREERNIRYYLTVPAIWNDAGKAATRAAAIQAGFLRDENDNRLTLVSEPEAAAIFCAKSGLLNLKIGDAILIVDCGGGTVDLIAYEVEEQSPFSVMECTAGSGDSCGSTALNRNFSNILRAKIRKMKLPDGSRVAGKVYAKCIMDFENRIKADFRNNGQKWAVDVGIEADFPDAGIEEGYMTFTNEEILQCFEPVVNRILELVRNQIIAIQAQNRLLQNVLVVGGFGASEYLFQQIKLHVPPQYQTKVVRPMDSVAAIVKGAVTAGITERVVTHRVARRHYLMATLQPFKEGYHPEQYRVPSLDGRDRCKYTRQIFVQKGERVKIGEPVKVSFFRQVAPGATLMYEDVLYACDEDVCPSIKEVVTLTSDLSRKNLETDFERMDTPQGIFYRVYFDIYLTLDGSEFSAELVCQNEIMGRCRAKFR
ncbi:hypothetical protein N7470_003831 [Penicillium chermesinum]|nr:hypothetical protein N7470_003831 [Penicillium chermesinum]